MYAESARARRAPDALDKTSQQIVAALVLPGHPADLPCHAGPLPMPDLRHLPRDGTMLYGLGHVDSSGRIASQEIIDAMGWQPGDGIEAITGPTAIVIRARSGGRVRLPHRPCVVIPVTARHRRGISAGDRVLLAAAPEDGIVIVHTLSELDEMLAEYHSSRSIAG